MSVILIYSPDDLIVPSRVIQVLHGAHTPDYDSVIYKLINPDLSNISGVSEKYWKVSDGSVVEMSSQEKESLEDYEKQEARYNPKSVDQIFSELDALFTAEQMAELNAGLSQAQLWVPAVIAGSYTMARTIAQQLVNAQVISQGVYDIIDQVLPLKR